MHTKSVLVCQKTEEIVDKKNLESQLSDKEEMVAVTNVHAILL